MPKYRMEFILSSQTVSPEGLKRSLQGSGEDLEVCRLNQDSSSRQEDFKIKLLTEDPRLVFDICGQWGRIRSVKVDEKS